MNSARSGRTTFPHPRKRGVNDSFRFPGWEIEIKRLNGKWSAVQLPKIGWVEFRAPRPMQGSLKNVAV